MTLTTLLIYIVSCITSWLCVRYTERKYIHEEPIPLILAIIITFTPFVNTVTTIVIIMDKFLDDIINNNKFKNLSRKFYCIKTNKTKGE